MTTIRQRTLAVIVCALAAGTMSSTASTAAVGRQEPAAHTIGPDIAPEALAQIDALIREKDTRSEAHRKIDSQLLYELKMEAGQPIAAGVSDLETDLPYADDGHLVIDVRARVTPGL